MTPITFDTHEFIKELKNAGFSEQQAEAITKLQKTRSPRMVDCAYLIVCS
ncbi:MAG: DUF1640 domain-containing protein [Verrucomicrobia bacterium]|nr:MAG: DUF1640 domain-containing protein [Verrucomicrobiota bacterium]